MIDDNFIEKLNKLSYSKEHKGCGNTQDISVIRCYDLAILLGLDFEDGKFNYSKEDLFYFKCEQYAHQVLKKKFDAIRVGDKEVFYIKEGTGFPDPGHTTKIDINTIFDWVPKT